MSIRPSVKTRCVADNYHGPGERVVEVWDAKLQKGCLLCLRRVDGGELEISVYRADPGVKVRIKGRSYKP
jgi:hypothetical protein